MDRIDILHSIVTQHGAGLFYSREGKIRKALSDTALETKDVEDLVEICTADRKLVKRILTEPDISRTRDEQKALVVELGGRSIAALRDVHTATYCYERKAVTNVSVSTGEFDDGRFVYTVVPARKQCLHLVRSLTPAAYDVVLPDTVLIDRKENKIVSIADGCFEGNDRIRSVKLPVSLETIGRNAFCNCGSLASVEFPRHLKSIGDNAFAHTAVTELRFQDYLEEIGNMAFYRCRSLRTVDLPKRTGQIGLGAFAGCTSLEDITVSEKNGRFMFEGGVLYSRRQDRIVQVAGSFRGKLSPPRTLTVIEQYAAEGCQGLTELDLPVSVESIGACAFSGCTGLAKVKVPNTVSRIGERAFEGCTGIRNISIPSSVRSIGRMAFSGCTELETGEIDGTMKYRDMRMFEGCTGLNRLTVRRGSDFTDSDFPRNTRIKYAHE